MLAAPPRVRAQSCHAASLRPTSGLTYRVALSGLFGNFATDATSGEYQGILATLAIEHPWFAAEVTVPGFRIAQIGSHAYGPGDVLISARGNLYRSADNVIVAGPEIAATLPTGSMEDGLGMGHVMLMPGAFVRWHNAGYSVIAQLSYGAALSSGDHAHHMGPAPIVNPMNRSELAHALSASAQLHPNLNLTGRLLGAVTVADHRGAAREVVAPGVQLVFGAFDASLELQVPVVGHPFSSRTLLSVGAQW